MAAQLAADGVAFASLTDHDSVEGLHGFRQESSRRGVGFVTGVEMTVRCNGAEAHLLGYGFDPAHHELQAALVSLRRALPPGAHSVAGPIGGGFPREGAGSAGAAPSGSIDIGDAIAVIHRAGGRAFLAHPLVFEPDLDRLRVLLADLKEKGLDGVEAFYGAHTDDQRASLSDLAEQLGLLASGGSDAHGRRGVSGGRLGVDMPTGLWKQFRDAVCRGPDAAHVGIEPGEVQHPRLRMKRRHFFFHVVFPALLVIALFAAAIFAVFLPAFERSLLDRKREMIRELTASAWSILAACERDERAGVVSRAQAQEMAVSRIEQLRYGPEGKDYFWLQDLQPRMIMHPYRTDLNGQDVSDFRDPRGVRIFVAFADLVRREGEGYIDYVWQWKDDPERLAPKQSYIRGFEPWGWIIGTGLYTEDVRQEIARAERGLLYTSVGISAIVALLLLYVMRHSLRLERERSDAEEGLRESTDRYRSLVEATTEGTLLVLDGRCRYANPTMLGMIGCSQQELELLDLEDLIPREPANEVAWERIGRVLGGEEPGGGFDGALRQRDGTLLECALALSRITFAGGGDLILLAKPFGAGAPGAGRSLPGVGSQALDQMSDAVPAGLFRARATSRGAVVACSPSAARLLRPPQAAEDAPLTLAALFPDVAAYEDFLSRVQRAGAAERRLHLPTKAPGTLTVLVKAVLVRDEGGAPRFLDGVIEDVTHQDKRDAEREALVERLQASMLFLHEPVSHVGQSVVFCQLDTPVRAVAAMMTASRSSAVLVRSESGDVIGIFTDRDLRERVVAPGADLGMPIHRVMSAPLATVPEHAGIYEALMAMEAHGIGHLAIADDAGQIVGVIRDRELLGFPDYGPIVLGREVARAATADEVVASCRRAPGLAKALLDSGAHARRVTRMLTSLCDTATERFIALAEAQLGPPPAPFAFLALGSHGRRELVLSSDQDNAIVYADGVEDPDGAASYFPELGRLVCGWLDQAGYPFCRGEIMAQNPKWCRPLSVWKRYFADWIRTGEAKEVVEFSIFFDFRAVCGAVELADELRDHVYEVVRGHPSFLMYLAQNALTFKPPPGLLGRILAGAAGGEHSGFLDLKDAVIPIVSFARLYALREGLAHTHTLDRLDALAERGTLTEPSRDETVAAYDLLMRLRLEHQAEDVDTDQAPDSLISYRGLGHLAGALLNQAFTQVAAVQSRISHDFPGGA